MTGLSAILGGVTGLVGAIAGGSGTPQSVNSQSGLNLNQSSQFQNGLQNNLGSTFGDYSNLVDQGPGQQSVTNANSSAASLSQMLQQYAQSGGLPNQQQIGTANQFAQQMYAPQQQSLQQNFLNSQYQTNQQSAAMGRGTDDPILTARLQNGYNQQQQQLNSQQGAYASNMALALPQQQLGYATQNNQLMQGLASQAMQNRSALLGMGSGLLGQQMNYQLGTSSKYNNANASQGGGLGGVINGGIAGFGQGMGYANMLSQGQQQFNPQNESIFNYTQRTNGYMAPGN